MAGKQAKTLSEKVKLSQLRSLEAVATTGSFSEAALQLNVSQSTVSHSIAALEDALGVVLIHRGPQRASLTPVGDLIFNQTRQILGLVADMGKEASRARGVEGGLVRIAAYRSMASEVLPEAIAILRERHPGIQVAITEYETIRGLADSLRDGKADFSVAELLRGEEYETFFIMEDPFIALVPQGDYPNPLTWETLRTQPLITSSSDCCRKILSFLKQASPPIEATYLIANDSTAVSMTRQGLGLSILPKLAAQPIPAEVNVAQLPFSFSRPLGISWYKSALLTPPTFALIDILKELYSPHPLSQAAS